MIGVRIFRYLVSKFNLFCFSEKCFIVCVVERKCSIINSCALGLRKQININYRELKNA